MAWLLLQEEQLPMRKFSIVFVLASLLSLAACNDDNDIAKELNIDRSGFTARFDLALDEPEIPYPNNLLFSPTGDDTKDGTLNIPFKPDDPAAATTMALNALDGFSTIAPMRTTFSSPIETSSLTSDSVQIFQVTLSSIPAGGVTSIVRQLEFNKEFAVSVSSLDTDPSQSTLVISPLAALTAKSHYLVMLTRDIKNTHGQSASPSAQYLIAKHTSPLVDGEGVSQVNTLKNEQAARLEPVRQLVNAQEAALANQGIDTSTVVLSWTFSTQSIGEVLQAVRTATTSSSSINTTSIGTTADLLAAGPGLANVYTGTLEVPYYLTNKDAKSTDPVTTFWQGAGGSNLTQFNTTPVATSTQTLPLMLCIPTTGSAPWPVVIYQHGITLDRSTVLAVADSLASQGFATVAIDLPLHGVSSGSPFHRDFERTFELDFINNTTGLPHAEGETPDGADPSGSHFINLTSLRTSRDNVRQGVADLFALTQALQSMDYDGGGADFDIDNLHFLGHSLGGMVGSIFVALEPQIKSVVLAAPGSGIPKLLDASARFGPRISAGLGAKGVIKGTADYENFLGAAQAVLDAGDPLNYAATTTTNRSVLLLEVIGDQVIPNNVLTDAPAGTIPAPLSGTDPLAIAMGLNKISETSENLNAWIRFTAGHHGSALTPNNAQDEPDETAATVFSTMQTAIASFFASNGANVTINDTSNVE